MSILLRGGTLLLHDSNDHVIPTKSDLLITGNIITKIAPEIEAEKGTMVIDCTDKIVSPGFIDTHRHLWQTPLKGRHANELLLGKMVPPHGRRNPDPRFLHPLFAHLLCFICSDLGRGLT